MDKEQLRVKIDAIDRQIIELLGQRLDISKKIANEKVKQGIEIYDREREDALINKLCNISENLPDDYIDSIYRLLLDKSRAIVKEML